MGTAGPDGTGVWAFSPDHYGVKATSNTGFAIYGHTNTPAGVAVVGEVGDLIARGIHLTPAGVGVAGLADDSTAVVGISRTGTGVSAASRDGTGLHATSPNGYAAVFGGRVAMSRHLKMQTSLTPDAPNDGARLFVRAGTTGKIELCVRFATGAVQVIATQP